MTQVSELRHMHSARHERRESLKCPTETILKRLTRDREVHQPPSGREVTMRENEV